MKDITNLTRHQYDHVSTHVIQFLLENCVVKNDLESPNVVVTSYIVSPSDPVTIPFMSPGVAVTIPFMSPSIDVTNYFMAPVVVGTKKMSPIVRIPTHPFP